ARWARERQLAAAARRRSPACGDGGRSAQLYRFKDLLPALGLARRARLVEPFKLADVRARAEVRARAAQDDSAQVSTRGDAREDFRKAFEHPARQRVTLFGAFEPDVCDRVALLNFDFSAQGV